MDFVTVASVLSFGLKALACCLLDSSLTPESRILNPTVCFHRHSSFVPALF